MYRTVQNPHHDSDSDSTQVVVRTRITELLLQLNGTHLILLTVRLVCKHNTIDGVCP